MSKTQCKICLLTPLDRDKVEEAIESGKKVSVIASQLGIARSSVRRHRDNHMDKEVEALLGVVQAPSDSVGTGGQVNQVSQNGVLESGQVVSKSYEETDNLLENYDQLLLDHGIDPEQFEIVGKVSHTRWQSAIKGTEDARWLVRYNFSFERKTAPIEEINLTTLIAQVKERRATRTISKPITQKALVVPFADPQIGKCGSRGDTEALINRSEEKREKLEEHLSQRNSKYSKIIFGDLGDVIEGFENTAQQQHTNDLSIMDQVDLAITIEDSFIETLRHHTSDMVLTGVPSNHSAWRRGKDYLGKPSDDWGIFSIKQLERLYNKMGYENIRYEYPEEWQKSITLDVFDNFRIGFAHGDEVNRPEAIPEWWAKQVHGGMPLATANMLVTGHFHTFRAMPHGRMAGTGKQKWWIGAPTLDNGSDWYANKAYGDSDPGLLVFEIDSETGFDLSSLRIL